MTTAPTSVARPGVLTSRPLRLAIDALFLVLALVWMVQDWQHRFVWTATFWGVLAAFWVGMLAFDSRRADLSSR
jgi:hypothetical protein